MPPADQESKATPVTPPEGQPGGAGAKAARVVPAPTLRFTSDPVDGLAIRLEHEDGTLGRRNDNAYVVAAPQVSRVHAQIERRAGSIVVTDLGSSGGTTVNGDKIAGPHVVTHGDTIQFGGVACRLEDPATAAMGEQQTMVMHVPEVDLGPQLSPRQQEVIELIAEGMTNAEIGDQLGISERTVKAYAQELYDKLGVRNRAGAVAEAVKHGLL